MDECFMNWYIHYNRVNNNKHKSICAFTFTHRIPERGDSRVHTQEDINDINIHTKWLSKQQWKTKRSRKQTRNKRSATHGKQISERSLAQWILSKIPAFYYSVFRLSSAWWRHQMETFSALLAICAGNSLMIGEFPAQRPVTRSFDFFSLIYAWINGWVNNGEAGDLRCHRTHYDVIVSSTLCYHLVNTLPW